jgi:hypothetical protein
MSAPMKVDLSDPRLLEYAESPTKLAGAIAGIVKLIELLPPERKVAIALACAAVGVTMPLKLKLKLPTESGAPFDEQLVPRG